MNISIFSSYQIVVFQGYIIQCGYYTRVLLINISNYLGMSSIITRYTRYNFLAEIFSSEVRIRLFFDFVVYLIPSFTLDIVTRSLFLRSGGHRVRFNLAFIVDSLLEDSMTLLVGAS